jgi:hypothetical protein
MMRFGVVLMLAVAVVLGALGCEDLGSSSSSSAVAASTTMAASETTATTLEVTTTSGVTVTEPATTITLAPTTTTAAPAATTTTNKKVALSAEALDYAASIGGRSHKGEKLYFVIGASCATEAEALAKLEPAKAVGDMQSYFIVQYSDNFDGMNPGWYVIFEAYHDYPSPENIEFCRRPFPGAYVKSATVLTSDPIPVYDDM